MLDHVPSLLRSRFVQWVSTPLRHHLNAHSSRVVRSRTIALEAEHRRDVGQLAHEVAVLSKRNHVQATNLAASIRLSEGTRAQVAHTCAQLTDIRTEVVDARDELAEIRKELAAARDRLGPSRGRNSATAPVAGRDV